MPNDDREQRFERALARHLPNASPDSACPDAEILAAYHERTLSADEMSQCKEHIAGCNRCQETLGLVEQTEHLPAAEWEQAGSEPIPAAAKSTETPLPISKAHPRPPWRWIVPVGAIAASVIFVIGVREIRTQRKQQVYNEQVAQNRLSIPQLPIPQSLPSDTATRRESPAAKLDKEIAPQKKAAIPAAHGSVATDSALSASAVPSSSGEAPAATKQKEGLAGVGGTTAAMAPSSAISGGATSRIAEAKPTSPHPSAAAETVPDRSAEEKQQPDKAVQSAAQTLQVPSAPPSLNTAQLEVNARSRHRQSFANCRRESSLHCCTRRSACLASRRCRQNRAQHRPRQNLEAATQRCNRGSNRRLGHLR